MTGTFFILDINKMPRFVWNGPLTGCQSSSSDNPLPGNYCKKSCRFLFISVVCNRMFGRCYYPLTIVDYNFIVTKMSLLSAAWHHDPHMQVDVDRWTADQVKWQIFVNFSCARTHLVTTWCCHSPYPKCKIVYSTTLRGQDTSSRCFIGNNVASLGWYSHPFLNVLNDQHCNVTWDSGFRS